jgi:hypothetical protein
MQQTARALNTTLMPLVLGQSANQLPLCIPKCQCLHLGRSNVNSNYTLCGSTVATVDQLTDLGVLRSSDYSYAPHIGSIVRKATRSAALLLRAFSTRNEEFLMLHLTICLILQRCHIYIINSRLQ